MSEPTWQDDLRQQLGVLLGRPLLDKAPRLRSEISDLFETMLSQHPAWTGPPGFAELTAETAAYGRSLLEVGEEESRTFVVPVPATAAVLAGRPARLTAVRVIVIRLSDGQVWQAAVGKDT